MCLPLQLDLNAAEEMDLRMLPGIDAARAREILVRRDRTGPFRDCEEFFQVAGLGTKDREAVRPVP